MDATKQSWEIDILYSLVRKAKFDLILHIGSITVNVAIEKKYSTMVHLLRELFAIASG